MVNGNNGRIGGAVRANRNGQKMRIFFVTTGLSTGGAERQLVELLRYLVQRGHKVQVVSLRPRGAISCEVEALGVPVEHLGIRRPTDMFQALGRLARIAHRFRPDFLQGWMYHGNLAASVIARIVNAPVIWGIRQSLYDLQREKPLTRMVIRLSARWSRKASAIVYNAHVARRHHEDIGFASERGYVIPNGFDSKKWHPDEGARHSVREELRVAKDAMLIGLVARYHPMKAHGVFLKAAKLLAAQRQNVHFVLVGRDVSPANPFFKPWLATEELRGRLHLLGERQDVPRLTAALDIASSSSWGEGFSNAIAEALLCGVPVVATDVGDARHIVGEAGILVPPGRPEALARAWGQLLNMGREARNRMGKAGRRRVSMHYDVETTAARYEALYANILEECS